MRTAALAATAALALPAAAAAAQRVVAAAPNRYVTPEVTIAQGEPLSLLNQDVSAHDVTARATGTDGRPLFASRLARTGDEVPVERVPSLEPGTYDFFCSIHPSMTGRLVVGGAGTDEPADERAPEVEVAIVDRRAKPVRRRGSLRVALRSDERADATVRGALRLGGRRYRLGARAVGLEAGRGAVVALRLPKPARRALGAGARARVEAVAVVADSAGNVSRATRTAVLR